MIWLLFTAMAFAAVVALLWPLLRAQAVPADRADYDLTVFRDQLAEVDRDVARGVLTDAEADAARLEIQRRMLAAAKHEAAPLRTETPLTRTLLTAGLAVAVPFVALALYMTVGAPLLSSTPGTRTAGGAADHGDADSKALVEKLAARMRQDPDNPEGWSLLARSYRQMERYSDAAEAYRNLMRLQPDDAEGFAGFGEVATAAANGQVTAEARAALIHALELDRDEPRAKFYLGMERAQAGDAKAALSIWRELTASAPKDAPWLGMVRGQMAQVAQEAGIMPMSVQPQHALDVIGGAAPATKAAAQVAAVPKASPAPPPATTPQLPSAPADKGLPDVGALKGRFSSENLDMIQGMVGGLVAKLQANPNDYDGWMLLGRSYTVLKDANGAKNAYGRAAALRPTDMAPKMQLADLMMAQYGLDGPVPLELVRVADDMRKLDAMHPTALFLLGLARANAGDGAGARTFWAQAVQVLPQTSPLRNEIARRMAALK